ncbi:hypothetical protein N493_15105 [Clostridium botulinum B2 433]|uniref:hypothetical protein n=1 Tax=Clostridium botulinum TaxID=1491 RepID=UPI0007E105D2|nr:hypothetical protein [Clostridium botulinum]KEI90735.1 hypothetical protein N493_15105 [Clostridium botulinum B2 433]
MGNFDWNEFKKGKVVVHCDTKEKAINFISKCNSYNMKWSDGTKVKSTECYFEECENGICYRFKNDDYGSVLTFEELSYYNNFYPIIKWEIENKIDYYKEYIIEEMMEFENGTVFADIKYPDSTVTIKYDIDNGCKILINNDTNSPCKITNIWLNTKFKLVKKDKKVPFEEAIQAYKKEVYCIWNDGKSKTEYRIESPLHGIRDVEFKKDITPEEILNGEWYIKEN